MEAYDYTDTSNTGQVDGFMFDCYTGFGPDCIIRMSTETEDEWTWIIKSLKKYAHLHMYELSQPTSVLEWMDQNTIFVADSSSVNGRYEILLLSLPPKLTNLDDDQGRLSKDRDFKMVSGGFHHEPVCAMAMVSDKFLVTSSCSDTDDIILWEVKEDEDVITQLKTLGGQRSSSLHAPSVAANPTTDAQIAKGSSLESLVLMNLETGKELWTNQVKGKSFQPLASIDYVDDSTLLVCSANSGQLHIIDTRSPSSASCSSIQPASSSTQSTSSCNESSLSAKSEKPISWSCSVNFQSRHRRADRAFRGGSRQLAGSLSSNGLMNIHDVRDVNKTICSVTVPTEGSGMSPCIRWSLNQDNLVSVSGWDHCVRIYDISSLENKGDTRNPAEPVFVHDGHKAEMQESEMWLTSNIWHEERPHLVLSAGSDSSLHAWDWLAT